MPTPRAGYFLADGTRVPSVTTVLGRFKDSGGLLQWAFQQGKAGAASLYEERDRAAAIGTVAHAMCEALLTGTDPEQQLAGAGLDADGAAKARTAFAAFQRWLDQQRGEVISAERPLVSELYRYGGTPDLVIRTPDGLAMADIKTSNAIHREYAVQVAAYAIAWDECNDEKITAGFHILRFGKEQADFEHRFFPRLDEARSMFLHLRAAYEMDLLLKRRAA